MRLFTFVLQPAMSYEPAIAAFAFLILCDLIVRVDNREVAEIPMHHPSHSSQSGEAKLASSQQQNQVCVIFM